MFSLCAAAGDNTRLEVIAFDLIGGVPRAWLIICSRYLPALDDFCRPGPAFYENKSKKIYPTHGCRAMDLPHSFVQRVRNVFCFTSAQIKIRAPRIPAPGSNERKYRIMILLQSLQQRHRF